MAITYVSAGSVAGTSFTLPTHQAGDLLVMFGYHTSSGTGITIPSGWVQRTSQASSGGRNGILAIKTATSSSESSGTWANASHLLCGVYRSNSSLYLWGGLLSNGSSASTTTINYAAIGAVTFSNTWFLGLVGTTTNGSGETAPTLMTNRHSLNSSGEVALHDTNANVASWASTNVATATVGYRSFVFEIFETDIAIPNGGSGGVPLIGTGGLVY